MIELVIADENAKVRSAIHLLLEQDTACWNVVSEVRNGEELFLAVEKNDPKLLLLDWDLPEGVGFLGENLDQNSSTRIQRLRNSHPQMHILVLSSKPQVKGKAILCGADAFVSKCDPPETLLRTLYSVCSHNEQYSLV
ncbi:MAG: hypothetical protein CVU39_14190 [Chloroflexi bacterium HGW-Chloroflexi-10]|nr:MAG: hypothetical protein CVU39_14190 [Chloroflexi bacterium HGW-Chloroflexi-10]